jgi:YHS domain-containing protein
MELTILEAGSEQVRAGYTCPCGCRPSVSYRQGDEAIHEGCCCGNEFVVGPEAARSLASREGFRLERTEFEAPWRERVEAAWLIGPSVHALEEEDREHGHGHASASTNASTQAGAGAIDPVCGMTVDPAAARLKGLHSRYKDADYHFCGKGCKLEFDEDPEQYLDPSYVPSM